MIDNDLRNKVIYQVFVRQYSKTHDLKAVSKDLLRIRNLGVDILYLMPIQPIGEANRKGNVGSPYSIQDYRSIDPDQGTMEDLKELIDQTHANGMKIVMDIVFNHTSRDSVLTKTHPDWFYHKKNGDFANRVGDWSDITDLDYSHRELFDYLYETLKLYVDSGIDGFRFDAAPLIPLSFWEYLMPKLKALNPDLILIAESVHVPFRKELLDMGYDISTEIDLYHHFDALYEYDSYPILERYAHGKARFNDYIAKVFEQEGYLPKGYVKLRYLENHDYGRARTLFPSQTAFTNMLAFLFFNRGLTFLFNGIETASDHHPYLFEYDEIDWSHYNECNAVNTIKAMCEIKKNPLLKEGSFHYLDNEEDIGYIFYQKENHILTGIFNPKGLKGKFKTKMNDGTYTNLFNQKEIVIENGYLNLLDDPVIIETE